VLVNGQRELKMEMLQQLLNVAMLAATQSAFFAVPNHRAALQGCAVVLEDGMLQVEEGKLLSIGHSSSDGWP
jgi:hypothetical protein